MRRGCAWPTPRGVQPVGAWEPAARVGQELEDLEQELDGGEDLGVGVRACLLHEQILERDGGRTMYWESVSRVLAEPAGMRIDASRD